MSFYSFAKRLCGLFSEAIFKRFRIEIQLADHCNLSCAGCSHFSPLAKEHFLNVSEYNKDCERLSRLIKKDINSIHLMGGEPLLHENIIEIIEITRKYFENTEIKVVTNGILLEKMIPEFWLACKKNNVMIAISIYPINLNMKKISELSVQYDVDVNMHGSSYRIKFRKDVYDTEGTQNIARSFKQCEKKHCHHLYKGKFFMCPSPAYIKWFNEYFSRELKVSDKDYIDIYQAKNRKTLLRYLKKSIPFCRYCNISENIVVPWRLSRRDVSEWT